MDGSFTSRRDPSPFTVRCTTLLACLWGAAAAYILCHSLIVTPDTRHTIAALVSLITVWAILERKRWGRMALIGVSVTTIGVFGFFISAFSAFSGSAQSEAVRSLRSALDKVANQYNISTPVICGLLLLAIVSSLWLYRAEVAAEFNRHKHAVLVTGQRVIATVLVACWGAAIALNPMLPFQQSRGKSSARTLSASPRRNAGTGHVTTPHSGQSRNSAPRRSPHSSSRR